MIIIRKKQTGEVFDIPVNFKMQIDNTSPIFNALGSLVLTAELPNDRPGTNRRLLGFPNQAESSSQPPSKMPVIVSYGSFIRSGSLTVNSAINSKRTFSVSIAFDEGEMYENMKSIKLKDLNNLTVIEKPIPELVTYLDDLAHNDAPYNELSVFSVSLDNFENKANDIFILNRFKADFVTSLVTLTELNYYFDSSGEKINVSLPGFGISPFIRIWKVVELIVAHLGYSIGKNPYKEHFQLRKLVALNNVADTLCTGKIDYKVLMPDITMGDFLSSLFARHGARLFFNSNTRVVDIILLKDILQSKEYTSFDKYQSSPYDLVFTKGKQLKITGQRNLYNASTSTDSWEEFFNRYNGQIGEVPFVSDFRPGGVWYSWMEGVFYQTATTQNAEPKFLSSIHFDWNKKVETMEFEEISGKDECVTQRTNIIMYIEAVMPVFTLVPAFYYTGLAVNQKQVEEKEVTCPLAFVFSMGNALTVVTFGSIFPHVPMYPETYYVDEEGNEYNYALTYSGKDGAFQRFFRDYDAFFRYSNHDLSCEFKLPLTFLSNPSFQNKAILANQPLLLDKIPHQLGAKDTVTVLAKTTRLYEPYDLEADYKEPISEGILYKWERRDDKEARREDVRLAKIAELKARETDPNWYPKYRFLNLTFINEVEDITKPSTEMWLLPPSQSDYESGRIVAKGTYQVKTAFRHSYEEYITEWIGKAETLTLTVTYSSWWVATLIN